jgi:hypothetical protein
MEFPRIRVRDLRSTAFREGRKNPCRTSNGEAALENNEIGRS